MEKSSKNLPTSKDVDVVITKYIQHTDLSNRIKLISEDFFTIAKNGTFTIAYLDGVHKVLMLSESENAETEKLRDEMFQTITHLRINIEKLQKK